VSILDIALGVALGTLFVEILVPIGVLLLGALLGISPWEDKTRRKTGERNETLRSICKIDPR
jgi:hypothetical protein